MTHVILSRLDAKNAGLLRYFNGRECKNGHLAERIVSSGGCVECARSWLIAANSTEYTREQRLKQKYKLTLADYAEMLARQNGVCAICGEPPKDGQKLAVDHCHEKGHVRALLCTPCNTAISHFESKRAPLYRAYVERWQ
jgi:hypothetical protein